MTFDANASDDIPNFWDARPSIEPDDLLRQLIESTPGAVRRAPQDKMVHAIHTALINGQNIAIQAGTGTGKSFGYLVGALASGSRVIVSTSTKQLGEQLASKDVPAVAQAAAALGRPVKVALLKGRSNYLCRARLDQTLDSAAQLDLGIQLDAATDNSAGEEVTSILDWASTTDTGDRTEAPRVSERTWNQFSTDAASCPGKKNCPFGLTCFAEAAKQRAANADVAIINHTLLAHYLQMQSSPLSAFDVLIADEAHDLDASLSRAWSFEINPARVERTLSAAKRLGPEVSTSISSASSALNTVKVQLSLQPEGELTSLPEEVSSNLLVIISALRTLSIEAGRKCDNADANTKTGWLMLAQRLDNTATELRSTLEVNREHYVQSVKRDRDDFVLSTEPLSISDKFPAALADWQLVLASATLTVGGRFEPLTDALGVEAVGVDVGTPFNYPQQAMLFIPPADFPAPIGSAEARSEHTTAVLETLEQLIAAAGGRTLGLFTTTKAAQNAARAMRQSFPHLTILGHGDAPMGQLTAQFREDETSVLLGTKGLWQGLDVQGASCSVVLIDKIPFPMFNDPLMSARKRKVDEAGGRGFDEVMVTHAAIALAQGAGRLIRTVHDRGVIAVTDPRLRTKYYGRALMRSLPPARAWDDLGEITDALRRLVGNGVTQLAA